MFENKFVVFKWAFRDFFTKEIVMPKVFGWEHITYLIIFLVIAIASLVLAKIFLKERKWQVLYIKVVAGLALLSNILCRIFVAIKDSNISHAFPYTICSLTSLLLPLAVLLGKENSNLYQGLWYLGLVGGLGTMLYPDFIGQNASVFYSCTITGLLHHSFDFLLCLAMWVFGWFRPNLKKCYFFPMIFCGYITVGAFAQHVLEINGSMLITKSVLEGTPINCWFILFVGTILIALFSLVYELIKKKCEKKQVVESKE